jgi:DNA mismatch endonuclease (patch repair protein)
MMQRDTEDEIIKGPRFKSTNGFITTPERGKLMSKIRSKDTSCEILLRKALWRVGIRYRKNYKLLPGRPDIIIKKNKVIIFIDGEFWHGYEWENKKLKLKTNRDFWIPKIERNMQRDTVNNQKLKDLGYLVIRFWENDVKKDIDKCLLEILKYCQ